MHMMFRIGCRVLHGFVFFAIGVLSMLPDIAVAVNGPGRDKIIGGTGFRSSSDVQVVINDDNLYYIQADFAGISVTSDVGPVHEGSLYEAIFIYTPPFSVDDEGRRADLSGQGPELTISSKDMAGLNSVVPSNVISRIYVDGVEFSNCVCFKVVQSAPTDFHLCYVSIFSGISDLKNDIVLRRPLAGYLHDESDCIVRLCVYLSAPCWSLYEKGVKVDCDGWILWKPGVDYILKYNKSEPSGQP